MIISDVWKYIYSQNANAVNLGQTFKSVFAFPNQRIQAVKGVEFHALNEIRVLAQLHFNNELITLFIHTRYIIYSASTVFGKARNLAFNKFYFGVIATGD